MRLAFGEAVLAALFVAFFALGAWFIRFGMTEGSVSHFSVGGALLFAATVLFFCFGLLSDAIIAPLAAVAVSLAAAWFLLLEGSVLGAVAVVPVLALSVASWLRMRHQSSLLLNPHFSSYAGAGAGLWFLGIAVLFAVATYLSLPDQEALIQIIPQKAVVVSSPVIVPFLKKTAGFDLTTSVDAFLGDSAGTKDPKKLDVARNELSGKLGIPLSGTMTFSDIIQEVMEQQLRRLFAVVGKYLVFGFIIVFVIAAQTISIPVMWASLIAGPLVIRAFRSAGFVESYEQTVTRNMLRWKRPSVPRT